MGRDRRRDAARDSHLVTQDWQTPALGNLLPMLRVLSRPRWLAGLALALVGLVGFVGLGLWQLDRHEQAQTRNERLADAGVYMGIPPTPLEYQVVEVEGRWVADSTFEVVPRYRNGVLGAEIVSVLQTEDGTLVAVNRGWTDQLGSRPQPVGDAATVRGPLIGSQGDNSDPLAERRFGRLDLGAIADDLGASLYAMAVVAYDVEPATPALNTDQILQPSDTPHLGYAFQWFGLAGVVLIGFPLLIRKASRDEAQ